MSIHTVAEPQTALVPQVSGTRPGLVRARAGATTARLLLLEARPVVQVIFALRFTSAAALGLAAGGTVTTRSITAAAAWLLLILVTYVANGAADVVEDQANGSGRPIASGRLAPGTANTVARAGTVVALVLADLSSPALTGLALVMATLGWGYSVGPRPLKCTTGGTTLAVVGGGLLTYAAGWQAVGGPLDPTLVGLALMMSAWMAVGGMSKDLGDVYGDHLAGRRTLRVRSEHRALCALTVAALGVGGAGLVLALALNGLVLTGGAVLCGGLLVARLAWTAGAGYEPEQRRAPYRAFMMTQYAAHALLFVTLSVS